MGHAVSFFIFPFSSIGIDHLFWWTGGTLAGHLDRSLFLEYLFPGVILSADSDTRPRNDKENHQDVRGRANSYFPRNVQLHFPREYSKRSREKCRSLSSAVTRPHRYGKWFPAGYRPGASKRTA